MNELLSQLISEVRRSLRFRWYGLAAAWALCLMGWSLVAWLPDVYEASASVFVDTSSDLEPLLRDQLVTSDVQAELAFVSRDLLSPERLDQIARTVGLDASAVTPIERQRVVTRLGDEIQISTESSVIQDNIYVISYRNSDLSKAVAVVRALYDGLIEDTLEARLVGTDNAETFIEDRIAEKERELEQAERALAEFKREHSDRLPGAEGDYFTRMQAERDELRDQEQELIILQARRDGLHQQLSGQAPMVGLADGPGVEPAPNSIDARIRAVQAELDASLLRLTERNPRVLALQEQLALLVAERDEQLASLGAEGGQELSTLGASPVHTATQIALNEVEVEIRALSTSITQRESRVAELQGLIDEVPAIEAQLAALNRDYEVIRENYVALVRDRESQELSRQAALANPIEFRPLNPPGALLTPVAPRRALLLVAVFVASVVAAGGLCFVLSRMFPVFGSVRSVQALLDLPVLGTVTQAWEATHRKQRQQAVVAFGGSLAGLFAVFLLVMAIEVLGPGIHVLLTGAAA